MSKCATCMMEECDASDPKFIKLHEVIWELRGSKPLGTLVKKKPRRKKDEKQS